MNKATPRNEWKHYHHSLNDALAKDCKTMIEWVLGISQSAFYRKLNSPQQLLSIADKLAIAWVYQINPLYLFPELGAVQRPVPAHTGTALRWMLQDTLTKAQQTQGAFTRALHETEAKLAAGEAMAEKLFGAAL